MPVRTHRVTIERALAGPLSTQARASHQGGIAFFYQRSAISS